RCIPFFSLTTPRPPKSTLVPYTTLFRSSLIIAIGAMIGNLVSCSLVAYAIARLNFRMKKFYFPIILATLMLPFHVLIIPQYIVRSEEHTSELQSRENLVCRLLLEKKNHY